MAVLIYAWLRGGWPERSCATATTLALLIGWALPFNALTAYRAVEPARLAIDSTLCMALIMVALYADRFWPIWIAALQLLTVAVHGVRGIDPDILPIVYSRAAEQFAWPIIAILAVGTAREARRRAATGRTGRAR